MDNICGPPVEGNQLKFRDKDIQEILTRLTAGNIYLCYKAGYTLVENN